jgi:hypothetical protein
MKPQRQPSDNPSNDVAVIIVTSGYEPPSVKLLGNVHDLLAMAKSTDVCDGVTFAPGDDPAINC